LTPRGKPKQAKAEAEVKATLASIISQDQTLESPQEQR